MVNRYIQGAAWSYLRKHPGSRVRDIAAALNRRSRPTSTLLRDMQARGLARHEGYSHKSVWFACGDIKPAAAWGMHANSLRNLVLTPEQREQYRRMAQAAKGYNQERVPPKPPRNPRKRYTGALEECWPVFPAQKQPQTC